MDSTRESILQRLRTARFRFGRKGYRFEDVDKYLEEVAAEAESVLGELRTANERIGQLEAELRQATQGRPPEGSGGVTEDALQQTLVLAQRFVEQTRRDTEEEALQIRTRAEEQARAVVEKAEESARQIATDLEDRQREELARLQSQRRQLEGDVQAMSKQLDEQRARLRESVTDVLKWIDQPLPTSLTLTNGSDSSAADADVDRKHFPGDVSHPAGNRVHPQQRPFDHARHGPGRIRPATDRRDGDDLETE